MAYINLSYRRKAEIECGNADARKADIQQAEDWTQKALGAARPMSRRPIRLPKLAWTPANSGRQQQCNEGARHAGSFAFCAGADAPHIFKRNALESLTGGLPSQDPDCQSRRDCAAPGSSVPRARHLTGGCLLRRRPQCTACSTRRRTYRLGPAPSVDSYLRGDRILEIAGRCGADAVHPGYGFLSENADFAEACATAGITFIGPPASAMRELGSKTRARAAADRARMPRTPGSVRGLASADEGLKIAKEIGYPVMLKAAAGGGGKGMRAIHRPEELASAFLSASDEALRAFGSGEVYLEKLIERPRHVEIQLLADQHGNVVYLGERECSVQRRHQKVIEEAPSAVVGPELRRRMGEAACRLAREAGYVMRARWSSWSMRRRTFIFSK